MISRNPLRKVEDALNARKITQEVFQIISDRYHIVTDGVKRVEAASDVRYPSYYIEPSLVISISELESAQLGIFFARTMPIVTEYKRLEIVIQITAPLIAFGSVGTIHAILAHEFIHYLDLIRKIMKMGILSDEVYDTLFESSYADSERLLNPRAIFRPDPTLVNHISRRFADGFRDLRLEKKAIDEWMNKGLPILRIPINTNVVKLPVELMAMLEVDPILKEKIGKFENTKLRHKKFKNYDQYSS